jgi:hypothetical protein
VSDPAEFIGLYEILVLKDETLGRRASAEVFPSPRTSIFVDLT